MGDDLAQPEFTPRDIWKLPTRFIGREVRVYDTIDSTNTQALRLDADAAHHGLVLMAERQTAGRGQYGRVWESPAGTGILLSVLLFPPAPLRQPMIMTALGAVCVGETILAATGLQARIKWPNDLLLHGKKVCGILTEQKQGVVIGIGLNVNQSTDDFERQGLPLATSLAVQAGRPFDRAMVARMLIEQLDEEYARLIDGERTTLEACFQWRVGLLGRVVNIELLTGSSLQGRLRDMTFEGIKIVSSGGELRTIPPEGIRHITPIDA